MSTSVIARAGLAVASACLAAGVVQAREAIPSIGPVPTAASALAPRALADLNRMIAEGDAFFDTGRGTACKVDIGQLQQKSDQAAAAAGGSLATVIRDSRRSMISGVCPAAGKDFQGPVEYIETTQASSEIGDIVIDVHTASRVSGVYAQARLVGESSTYTRVNSASSHRLSSGQLVAPQAGQGLHSTYTVDYASRDPSGKTIKPSVRFSWDAKQKVVTIALTESPDGQRQVMTIYSHGKPSMRMRLKDGVYHGWWEYFDPALVQLKQDKVCYQNGIQVQALQCPDI